MKNPYEQFQLSRIVAEYRSKGYQVDLDQALDGIDYPFDAIAQKPDEAPIMIVLVNARRSQEEVAGLQGAVEQAAKLFPKASVDMRFLDPVDPSWSLGRNPRPLATHAKEDVQASPESEALAIWAQIATQIRAASRHLPPSNPAPGDVLTLYNELLASGVLQAPEDIDDAVEKGVFDLYEPVMGAMQGMAVSAQEVSQLRACHACLARQVASFKPMRPR